MMADISSGTVKELRERTGAGMMDCKRALVEAAGDIDVAAELLRKAGQAKADKKAARIAAEGLIVTAHGSGRHAIVEINSETDFVAKDENFRGFADAVAAALVETGPADVAGLMALERGGQTLEEARLALVTKVGENIGVRRFETFASDAIVGTYVHMGRIGVLVELEGGDEALARDLAMHVAAAAPRFVSAADIPESEVAKEREIIAAQAEGVGKPADIVAKIIDGKLKKHLDQVTLLGQEFVKNPEQRVRDLLAARNARVRRFVRYEVGEGIDKKSEDFAAEVMAQASRNR
jgi:elongation factor Ts